VPAVMPTRVTVAMTAATPDLELVGSSLEVFDSRRGRTCCVAGRKDKSRVGGSGDRMYFNRGSLELIAAGTERNRTASCALEG
jgi:hypothetical protein